MKLLREEGADFEGAISRASEELGLAQLFVEKDYWVTQVLRALHERHPGAFVVKGGTSLSKGYGLIERFSEDVDILVTPASDDSTKKREQLLQPLTRDVAEFLDLKTIEGRPPGRGKHPHRADVLVYPRVVESVVAVPVEDRGVLLETGYGGGEWPAEMVTITPLVNVAGIEPGEYADTEPIKIRALKPARTCSRRSRSCTTSPHAGSRTQPWPTSGVGATTTTSTACSTTSPLGARSRIAGTSSGSGR